MCLLDVAETTDRAQAPVSGPRWVGRRGRSDAGHGGRRHLAHVATPYAVRDTRHAYGPLVALPGSGTGPV